MSFSDSESSSHGGDMEYKTFRQISRDRLLNEMLGAAKIGDPKSWKVLIMDKVTVKVMSHNCKMADITDQGVSLVEDLFRRRQPLPSMDAIYFLQPSKENVVMFLSDMSGREPLYKKAFVYFSAPIPKEYVNHIKSDTSVLPRIGALREMNLEYFPIDNQAFITDNGNALEELLGNVENSHKFNACLNVVATRIGTVFASLKREKATGRIAQIPVSEAYLGRVINALAKPIDGRGEISSSESRLIESPAPGIISRRSVYEPLQTGLIAPRCKRFPKIKDEDGIGMLVHLVTGFGEPTGRSSFSLMRNEYPFVRYRAGRALEEPTATSSRDLVPSKLASAIWNCITNYKSSIPNFPQSETCELLILDRSIDQIAPVIHEWTYDAMCHDLLDMDGNKFTYEIPSKKGGQPERKEVVLDDNDPIWLELRNVHIADASERLHEKTNSVSKNKAAQIQQSARDGNEISTRDLQKMVQALPQYTEQVDKISLHVEIAGRINKIIRETKLRELGQLEQDLVFGDAGAKDVINFLRTNQNISPENKLRLLMIYASVYPEKFEGDKASKIMQLARLSTEDMKVVNNMRLLAGSDSKKSTTGGFSLKFNAQKTKEATRKDRTGDEETWQLLRFYPMIEELIENLCKGELPKNEYPCMNPLTVEKESKRVVPASSVQTSQSTTAHSMRSRRTPNWARPSRSDDGYSSDSILKNATTGHKKMGTRVFVFIIGGATRSELRVCHKLMTKLRREVVLGCTSLDDPPQYLTKLKLLFERELSLNGLGI